MKRFAVFAVLGLFIALATLANCASDNPKAEAPSTGAAGIQWMPYDQGLTLAKKENKHIFIDFTTSWCGWCKKMEKETFSESDVIKLVSDNFIAVKVDGDSKKVLDIDGYKVTEQSLTRNEFGVSGYPSFWFLKPDGSKIGLVKGYRPKDQMVEMLNYVKDELYDTTKAGQQGTQKK